MLLQIPGVLAAQELAHCQRLLERAEWIDGRVTAGHQSAQVKHNRQLAEHSEVALDLGKVVLGAVSRSPLFISAALPNRIFPPLFNCYDVGDGFGTHVDNAIRIASASGMRVRTDVSATLFLSEPTDYDGGELVVEDTYGTHSVKLPAGAIVLYPASSLHHVKAITRGRRIASFFWIQSMVRDDGQRALLFDLDNAIRRLGADHPSHPSVVQLTGVYHNLLRSWAEV
ncbi:MAG TPA: Fe2+-dependent dioxygenase [Steroidobacteraceae bacterium]|nr:Fe2+-dependent dioxygenase [Steroidobacteraceae bacterium]